MALSSSRPQPSTGPLLCDAGSLTRRADGFERTLGLMLARLASARSHDLGAAVSDALRDLCRVGSLGLAGVLRVSREASLLEVRVEAAGQNGELSRLCTGLGPDTHRCLVQELGWTSPSIVDVDVPAEGTRELAVELEQRGLVSAALTYVELEGNSSHCMFLASSSRNLLDGATFSRVRLIADMLALALSRQDVTLARRELEARSRGLGEVSPVRPMTDAQIRAYERENLLRTLEACDWKIQGPRGAARSLGLSPSTLRDRMKSFGLARPRPEAG